MDAATTRLRLAARSRDSTSRDQSKERSRPMTIPRLVQASRGVAVLIFVVVIAFSTSAASAQTSATTARSAAQLEQLVAPIALYPDALMSQVLMASTYPLE